MCKCVQLIKAHFVAKWKMLFRLDSLFNGIFLINHPYFKMIPFFAYWPFLNSPQQYTIRTHFSWSNIGHFLGFCHRICDADRRKSYTTYPISTNTKYQMKLVLQWLRLIFPPCILHYYLWGTRIVTTHPYIINIRYCSKKYLISELRRMTHFYDFMYVRIVLM